MSEEANIPLLERIAHQKLEIDRARLAVVSNRERFADQLRLSAERLYDEQMESTIQRQAEDFLAWSPEQVRRLKEDFTGLKIKIPDLITFYMERSEELAVLNEEKLRLSSAFKSRLPWFYRTNDVLPYVVGHLGQFLSERGLDGLGKGPWGNVDQSEANLKTKVAYRGDLGTLQSPSVQRELESAVSQLVRALYDMDQLQTQLAKEQALAMWQAA